MTKQEKLETFVRICVDNYGLERIKLNNKKVFLALHTFVGPLYISRIECGRNYSRIFMTFKNKILASKYLDCNPNTVEWNICTKTIKDTEYLFDFFMQKLVRLG